MLIDKPVYIVLKDSHRLWELPRMFDPVVISI